MGRIRRCNSRCHNARKPRCRCWCGGTFHGKDGAANRVALAHGLVNLEELEEHGFKTDGTTAYIEKKPLEVANV